MTKRQALGLADVADLDNEKRILILGKIDKIRELGVSENVSLPQVCPHLVQRQPADCVRSLSSLEISLVGSHRF